MISTEHLRHDSDIDRLLKTLRHEETDRIPNFEYLICPRNVSAILGEPAGSSWDLEPEDYVALVTRIGMDAVGGPIFTKRGQLLTSVKRGMLKNRDDFARLREDGVIAPAEVDHQKIERFFAAVEGTRLGIWHHISAGLTQVYDSMGLEHFCLALYDDPSFIEELLDRAIEDNQSVLAELAQYPFSFYHFGDDLGHKGGLLVPPDFLRQVWAPRVRKMVAPLTERGIPVTFHCDGKIDEAIPIIIELGFCSLNPIEPYGMDIYEVKRLYGDKLCLVGNIDVAGPLAFGTPEEVVAEVEEHIARLAPGGGYVGATSHSVLDDIPPENFIAMVAAFQGAADDLRKSRL